VHFVDDSTILFLLPARNSTGVNRRHTASELSKFLISTARKFDLMKNMIFVSVDNTSNAKRQVQLTGAEEEKLTDIYH